MSNDPIASSNFGRNATPGFHDTEDGTVLATPPFGPHRKVVRLSVSARILERRGWTARQARKGTADASIGSPQA